MQISLLGTFFIASGLKYALYQLFDVDNPVNRHYERLLFSTEGHTFPIVKKLRRNPIGDSYTEDGNTGASIASAFSQWAMPEMNNGWS